MQTFCDYKQLQQVIFKMKEPNVIIYYYIVSLIDSNITSVDL